MPTDFLERDTQDAITARQARSYESQPPMSAPLLRAATLAQRASVEKRISDNADRQFQLDEEKKQLSQNRYDLDVAKQKAAIVQQGAKQKDEANFIGELTALQQSMNPTSPQFHRAALELGTRYPEVAKSTFGSGVMKHSYESLNAEPYDQERATALWEVGNARRELGAINDPQEKLSYLESIPTKYPKAFKAGSPESGLFKGLYDETHKAAVPVSEVPAGMELMTKTVPGLGGGTETYRNPKAAVPVKPDGAEKAAKVRDAIVHGEVAFGTLDGTKFKPDEHTKAQGDWTHANVSYQDPSTGALKKANIPRAQWDQFAADAEKQAASPKETPEQIVARIKSNGGTKEDAVKALRDAGHSY